MPNQEHNRVLQKCCGPVKGPSAPLKKPPCDVPEKHDQPSSAEFKKERSHKGL